MTIAKCIGRIGTLAVTLGVGIAVAAAPGVPVAEAADSADRTALMLGGSGIPTWNDADVKVIMDRFIAPTYPDQTIDPVAVTIPNELWPGGLLAGPLVCLAICPGSVFGLGHSGGSAWVDAPWWKLLGLFDRTFDQSVQAGVADLEDAMAEHGNDHLVIYGYSQGATVANLEKRKLAEQYPGADAPDIDFVLGGDTNLPNGGLLARFPGLYIPILDFSFNGPEPTDTQFDTVVITRQYDFMADFPLYPLNFIADANALLGFVYAHLYPFDVSLADPSAPLPDTHGNTDYYFFETHDLPLFGPLRTLGVPEALIDVVEPFFRVLVELGYDRTIPPWEPTPARLIPTFNPVTVTTDLVAAIGEGINNAMGLFGAPSPLSIPAAQRTTDHDAAVEQVVSAPQMSQSTFVAEQPLATPTSAPMLEPQLSLTTNSPSTLVASLSPRPQPGSNPTPTSNDNVGTTPTDSSLTTTDLTLPSTLSPAAPSNGPLVRTGNLFTPGSTTPAPTQSGTTNMQSTTATTTTTTTGTTMTTTTSTSTTTDGSKTTDQAGGDADSS